MTNLYQKEDKKNNKKRFITIGLCGVGIVALIFLCLWLFSWRYYVSTDDAYVNGDIATISPKVGGYLEQINVLPNMAVKKGDILFKLDEKDYKIALDRAIIQIEAQQQTLKTLDAQIEAAKSSLRSAQAQKDAVSAIKTNAFQQLQRLQQLNKGRYTTQAQLDSGLSQLHQADANLKSAKAQADAAQSNIDVLTAKKNEAVIQLKALKLAAEKAQHDFDAASLHAPFDGVISNIIAKKGDLISIGQRLAALVPTQELYIEANYKETQIGHIKTGESVDITIDGLKGETLTGRVASISPATGSVFSLLPPQNATGNFTKVVQRVPVRISLPKTALLSGNIRAGMSAVVDIDTRTAPQHIAASYQQK